MKKDIALKQNDSHFRVGDGLQMCYKKTSVSRQIESKIKERLELVWVETAPT